MIFHCHVHEIKKLNGNKHIKGYNSLVPLPSLSQGVFNSSSFPSLSPWHEWCSPEGQDLPPALISLIHPTKSRHLHHLFFCSFHPTFPAATNTRHLFVFHSWEQRDVDCRQREGYEAWAGNKPCVPPYILAAKLLAVHWQKITLFTQQAVSLYIE